MANPFVHVSDGSDPYSLANEEPVKPDFATNFRTPGYTALIFSGSPFRLKD